LYVGLEGQLFAQMLLHFHPSYVVVTLQFEHPEEQIVEHAKTAFLSGICVVSSVKIRRTNNNLSILLNINLI
jgi:hypothetical protein